VVQPPEPPPPVQYYPERAFPQAQTMPEPARAAPPTPITPALQTMATSAVTAGPVGSPPIYVDVPVTRHRLVFSYLGSPTAIIMASCAFLVLVAATLPLVTVVGCAGVWCGLGVRVSPTAFSLMYVFSFIGIVPAGALLVLLTPGLSLLGRSYGRVLRSLTYVLIGLLTIMSLLTYALFYQQYLIRMDQAQSLEVYYPFYLIMVAASVFIFMGILEWLRRPRLLFRSYVPPPPKSPTPKRMPVPEVVQPSPQPATAPVSTPTAFELPTSHIAAESERKPKTILIFAVVAGIAYLISSLLNYAVTLNALGLFFLEVIPPVFALVLFAAAYVMHSRPNRQRMIGILMLVVSVVGLVESLYLLNIVSIALSILPYAPTADLGRLTSIIVGVACLLVGSVLGLVGGALAIRWKREEERREPSRVSSPAEPAIPPKITMSRPLGVTLLAAYYMISGVCAIAIVPFSVSLVESIRQSSLAGGQLFGFPDLTYLWILQVLSALVTFVMAYGLVKGKEWARVTIRILSGLAVLGVLISIAAVTVMVSPALVMAGTFAPFMGGIIAMVYGILALAALLGIAVPLAIFWYMGRPHVKAYFARGSSKGV